VVLVEVKEIVGPEAVEIAPAAAGDRVQYLPLVDGVAVVEGDGVDDGPMIKAKSFATTPLAREP
jgi:hypothetical protein